MGSKIEWPCDGCMDNEAICAPCNEDGSCPCTICIVKPTCDHRDRSECDEWWKWWMPCQK